MRRKIVKICVTGTSRWQINIEGMGSDLLADIGHAVSQAAAKHGAVLVNGSDPFASVKATAKKEPRRVRAVKQAGENAAG